MKTKPDAYIGIDPGEKGAICVLIPSTKQVVFRPTTGKPMDAYQWYLKVTKEVNVHVVMIEDVHSLFGMSAKSNFTFGANVDRVFTIPAVLGLSIAKVTPKNWHKHVGVKCTVKGKARPKALKLAVAALCDQLYPKVSIRGPKGGLLDGLSDALMVAHYASQTFK